MTALDVSHTVKKWVVTVAQRCVSIGTIVNLLSSILTILLTCPNNDTVLCYSNDPFLTVHAPCYCLHGPSSPSPS